MSSPGRGQIRATSTTTLNISVTFLCLATAGSGNIGRPADESPIESRRNRGDRHEWAGATDFLVLKLYPAFSGWYRICGAMGLIMV
jgi:hypothetical protein